MPAIVGLAGGGGCWGVCIMSDLPVSEGKGRLKAGCSCLADLAPS